MQAERSNYYDLGVEQRSTQELTVGVDSYYKQATDLIDEGQFGAPDHPDAVQLRVRAGVRRGIHGATTTSATSRPTPTSPRSARIGKDIVPSQFNFAADDLAYIADHYIHLDHEQQLTASGGASYVWRGTRISADLLLGSGLRAIWAARRQRIPNGDHLPYYKQINLGVSHDFDRQGVEG